MTVPRLSVRAAHRTASVLVWAVLVAFALLLAAAPGTVRAAANEASDTRAALPVATLLAAAGAPSERLAAESRFTPMGVAPKRTAGVRIERLGALCRDLAPWPARAAEAVVCDLPVPMADPSEPEARFVVPDGSRDTWLRTGRRAAPPDPQGTSPAPLLRPPTV
jgi:hypothetical protein